MKRTITNSLLVLGLFFSFLYCENGFASESSAVAKNVVKAIEKRMNGKGKVVILDETKPNVLEGFSYVKLNITTDADNKTLGFYTNGKYVVTGLVDINTGDNLVNYIKAVSDIVNIEIRSDEFYYGNPDAKLKIVVFSDFECPYCKATSNELKSISKSVDTAIFYKHFPLSNHKNAELLAKIYEAGKKLGYKWDMYKYDYANKNNDEILKIFENNLPKDKLVEFYKYLNSQEVKDKINKNKQEGDKIGIKGTPYILINNHPIEGYQPNLIKQIIKNEIEKK